MATTDNYYAYSSTDNSTGGVIDNWSFSGSASYETNHDGYIKVDKGSPDKAKFVIFYAVENKDPMIFCKNKKELDSEIKKLLKREDVDKKSIRWFNFSGGIKKM